MNHYIENDIAANGIRIHYYRSTPPGGAIPIVMLHGLTDNGMCWVRVADKLRDSYDIILPDTRGHGFSDKPAAGYSIEERAADIAHLIDALGLDRPVLFGHSLGGEAAAAVAGLYPDKVRALVLEDPAWFNEDNPEQRAQSAEDWSAGLLRDQNLGREGLIAKGHQENPAWHADELSTWADAKLQMSEAALREIHLSMRPGWQHFVSHIQCPVLLVTGDVERGIIINSAMVQKASALNPRIQEANIPHAGHCIHRDQFEPYMEKVKSFLVEMS